MLYDHVGDFVQNMLAKNKRWKTLQKTQMNTQQEL